MNNFFQAGEKYRLKNSNGEIRFCLFSQNNIVVLSNDTPSAIAYVVQNIHWCMYEKVPEEKVFYGRLTNQMDYRVELDKCGTLQGDRDNIKITYLDNKLAKVELI